MKVLYEWPPNSGEQQTHVAVTLKTRHLHKIAGNVSDKCNLKLHCGKVFFPKFFGIF